MKGEYGTFSVFAEHDLGQVLAAEVEKMRKEVNGQPDDYILNVNEETYIEYLVGKYTVDNLGFDFDAIAVSDYEKDIPAQRFPFDFSVREGTSYRKSVVRWHVPFRGDPMLLRCVPSTRQLMTYEMRIEEGCLCFDLVNFRDQPDELKREADQITNFLKHQSQYVINQVDGFNRAVKAQAQEMFQSRRQALLKKNNTLAALGVPIRQRAGVAGTFAVPTPKIRQKITVSKPVVTEKGFRPEPTLDVAVYESILKVIQDVGKQFERMPSTYAGKEEEHLRDHFLLQLEPNFEGSATGETFNKTGKTDILLRYDGSNIFVAECKFWRGSKGYFETIDQLLGYLTWRDSKAAVILFVERKDFSAVLETVQADSPKHPNYLGYVNVTDETRFNYRFHINGDPNREVRLAVLLFHLPAM